MFDREFATHVNTSPFAGFYTTELFKKDVIDAFQHRVRSIVVAEDQVPLLKELQAEYGNGYTRSGMSLGYPYGGYTTATKMHLLKYAIEHEVEEADVGTNICAMRSGDIQRAKDEMKRMVDYAAGRIRLVCIPWLIRNSLEGIREMCDMLKEAGVTALKTNGGGYFGYMEVEHIKYVKDHYGDQFEIEVAGRCRSRDVAEEMYRVGATSFHLSSWRRMSGIGNDLTWDPINKVAAFTEYKVKAK